MVWILTYGIQNNVKLLRFFVQNVVKDIEKRLKFKFPKTTTFTDTSQI